jgi:hypothetical protein
MRARCLVVAALLVLTAGCGTTPGAGPQATAVRFTDAVSDDDLPRACLLLAPETRAQLESSAGKPCAAALGEEDLPAADAARSTEVFGTMAQVRFAGDTVFVTKFAPGWRVLAAGCSPVPGAPYDCLLQGG